MINLDKKIMITPKDIKNIEEQKVQEAIKEINKKLVTIHGTYDYDYEYFYTDSMFSDSIIKIVAERYKQVGWNYIYYRKTNLTGIGVNFIFSTKPLEEQIVKNFNKL